MRTPTASLIRSPFLISFLLVAGLTVAALGLSGCAAEQPTGSADMDVASQPPAEAVCDNDALTGYDALLVIAPHPDDEVLGFSGLMTAYLEQGKTVEVIVSTDGDAYCDACRFWKSGSTRGATCSALDFSNFETAEIDSFAEVRRSESTAALEIVGAGLPTFLGYPDTGLAAAWANYEGEDLDKPLNRSDFSDCESCETCGSGYGGGPATELTATTLMDSIRQRIAATPENTLLATTHWLDGHGDHASLGKFVKLLNGELDAPRAVAYTVIHANTPKNASHADCWYPGPEAAICPCADEDHALANPEWIAGLRNERYQPEQPGALPDDAEYGETTHLCIAEKLYKGEGAIKRAAIDSYASQLGFAAREGELDPALAGIMDCSGYLISFVHSTEPFVLLEPEPTTS